MKEQPNKPIELTARDAAKLFIQPYVLRGDNIEFLKQGRMSTWSDRYKASIGGVLRKTLPGGGDQVRGISPDKILVMEVEGRKIEPPAIYSLSELYDEVQRDNDPEAYSQKRLF